MKRELKVFKIRELTAFRSLTKLIPMKRELKVTVSPFITVCGFALTKLIPMKRELKARS